MLLTDGGIYDNLGLSVLEPGRSAAHTAHAYAVNYIIACDAGRGRLPLASGHFAGARLWRSFDVVHRRAQDASLGVLHEAAAAGLIDGFRHAHLGMPDARLPIPVFDLVWNAMHTFIRVPVAALLAYGAAAVPAEPYEARTDRTITTRTALEAELAAVREHGYAVTAEELEPGLVAVAAPVFAGGPAAIAAISVSAPSSRLAGDLVHVTAARCVAAASALSAMLSGPSDLGAVRGRTAA